MKEPKNTIYKNLYNRLNVAGFQHRFKTFKPGAGTIDILQVNRNTNEVSYCPVEEIAHDIIEFAHISKNCDLGPNECFSMARWWAVINEKEKGLKRLPKSIAEKSDRELAFRRLPFDYVSSKKLPEPTNFLDFCRRVSDPAILQAFIGSIFVDESYRQQYLYIFGQGNDGKGTLFNFLKKLLGQTYISEDVPSRDAKFWLANLRGKRLCVFPDLEDPTFPASTIFKKLTGDDLLRMEEKFKMATYEYINAKFIMGGNDELQITKTRADLRRALYLSVEGYKGPTDTRYGEKLWAEAPSIYALCLEKYREICPNHGPIPQAYEEKNSVAFAYELETDRFFNTYFEPYDKGEISGAQWQSAKHDYFQRKPTKQEESMLNQELLIRGYTKIRMTKGWIIKGLRTKSNLVLMSERAREVNKVSEWPNN